MVSHPSIRHRRLADADRIGHLGHRARHEGLPRASPPCLAARPAPVARRTGCVVHGDPSRRPRRRQLRPLQCRRPPHPVRLAVPNRRSRHGRHRDVAPCRHRGHISGHEAHPARRYWRWIHLSSYAVFLLTSLHAAFAGSDRTNWLYQGTAAATIAAVMVATIYRLLHRRPVRTARTASVAATRTTSQSRTNVRL